MADDANVFFMLDLIFSEQALDPSELISKNPSMSLFLLTKEFSQSIIDVLSGKQFVVARKWENYFDTCCYKIMSSSKMYIKFTMYALLCEHIYNNVFETLLGACAFVLNLSGEIFHKTGVDFHHLNNDIIKIFYKNRLKDIFSRRGGFRRFVKYILNHRYTKWRLEKKDLFSSSNPEALYQQKIDEVFRLQKEFEREKYHDTVFDPQAIEYDPVSYDYTEEVLKITVVQLPNVPSYEELVMRLVAFRKRILSQNVETEASEKLAVVKLPSQENSISKSDSKTKIVAKQEGKAFDCENIVQAVIRCNRSKSSAHKTNNRIPEKVEEILEHLKDTVKSLLEIVDK